MQQYGEAFKYTFTIFSLKSIVNNLTYKFVFFVRIAVTINDRQFPYNIFAVANFQTGFAYSLSALKLFKMKFGDIYDSLIFIYSL